MKQSPPLRQKKRYRPNIGEPYHELNDAISTKLDGLKHLLLEKRILDIGAGEIPFAGFYEGLQVDTCDIGQNSSGSIDFIIEPDGNLPFPDGSYDVLLVFDVLEHVKADVRFIQECSRVLRPGGRIILTVPFMYRFHEEPFDYRRYTPSGIDYLLGEIGALNVLEIEPIGSSLFIVETILLERSFRPRGWRRLVHAVLYRMVRYLKLSSEVSPNCPFSYFVLAGKGQNE
jgi:SAM-dependent methyltransferase